jgi:hypothetical protein
MSTCESSSAALVQGNANAQGGGGKEAGKLGLALSRIGVEKMPSCVVMGVNGVVGVV